MRREEIGPFQVRIAEVGPLQVRLEEVGPLDVGPAEQGPLQVRLTEVGPLQVRADEVCPLQMCPAKDGPLYVEVRRPSKLVAPRPLRQPGGVGPAEPDSVKRPLTIAVVGVGCVPGVQDAL